MLCLSLAMIQDKQKQALKNYPVSRVVELPWSSPWTWLLTALLVDLGYYWYGKLFCNMFEILLVFIVFTVS